MNYARPTSVDAALDLLAADRWRLLAGGTDFYPAQGAEPIADNVLDLNGLAELRGICAGGTHVVIGARTSWSDIVNADLPPAFDALKQAAREVGAIQIQNSGTIAGNLCNASPAADGVPPLLVLDAELELRSASGMRLVPLLGFITGNRHTVRRADELVTAIRVSREAATGSSRFVKLGARRYLVISIAMAAAQIVARDGKITSAAISVGACSEVAMRLSSLENALVGQRIGALDDAAFAPGHFDALSPIDDVRGSGDYRRSAAREIVRRAVVAAGEAALNASPRREVAA